MQGRVRWGVVRMERPRGEERKTGEEGALVLEGGGRVCFSFLEATVGT